MTTSFSEVYDMFLSKVTDDMYMELFPEETEDILEDLLIAAIPWFEFPRVDISDYDVVSGSFGVTLSNEEVNILATYMVVTWLGQQSANVDLVRQKYSASDFRMTSQAAHLKAISSLRDSYLKEGTHLQRLYKRREKNSDGRMVSTMSQIMEVDS